MMPRLYQISYSVRGDPLALSDLGVHFAPPLGLNVLLLPTSAVAAAQTWLAHHTFYTDFLTHF